MVDNFKKIKILHLADSHFQAKRLDECLKNFKFIIDYGKENKPDLIFHAGDLFDKNTLINSSDFRAAIWSIEQLANIAPIIIVRGNHDPKNALDILGKIKAKNPIKVFEEIDTFIIQSDFLLSTKLSCDINLLLIPYIPPSIIGSGETIGSIHITGADSLRKKIKEFINSCKSEKLNFIISHISVLDAELANSEKIQEGEILLNIKDLDLKEINGVFLGHIHKNNQQIFNETRIRYAGSHYRITYAERGQPGFYWWEFKQDYESQQWDEPEIKFISTPARNMYVFEIDEKETRKFIKTGKLSFDIPENSDIKIVFEVPEGMSTMIDNNSIKSPNDSKIDICKRVKPKNIVRSESISKILSESDRVVEWGRLTGNKITESIKKKVDKIVNEVA